MDELHSPQFPLAEAANPTSEIPAFRFPHLNLARYEFRLRACSPCALPAFLGSTLRGAFGHALKKISCSVAHEDCTRCWLTEACTYPLIFEGTLRQAARARRDTPPHPYVFRPPLLHLDDQITARNKADNYNTSGTIERHLKTGEQLSFEILLLGEAAARFPYVILAVRTMAENGLGFARAPFELDAAYSIAPDGTRNTVFDGAHHQSGFPVPTPATLTDFVAARFDEASIDDCLKLRLLTPLRLRVEGEISHDLSFELLLRNVMRRLHLLFTAFSLEPFAADYRAMLDLAARITTRRSRLAWHDLDRYSNRQQAKQKLGGLLGEVEYAGEELSGFMPLMLAGELLHIGSSTVFGLGRYEIVG